MGGKEESSIAGSTISKPQISISALQAEADKLAANPFTEKFKASILDQTKDYPAPVPVITLRQNLEAVTLLSLKSFSLWQGKAKSKKTTALALAIAAFISQNSSVNNIQFEKTMQGTALFFDTEQGESYAARTMKLILKLAGLTTSPNLIYCDLREFPTNERIKIIQAGIENTPDVKIVVIDGIVDLMVDFMSSEEGHVTITEIIKFCSIYNIHVAGVLHQNKKDKNARAHVGTISSQKCEIEISAEVDPLDKSKSIISCENSRGISFQPFTIKWENGSMPHICQDTITIPLHEAKNAKRMEELTQTAKAIFGNSVSLNHSEIMDRVMTKYGKVKNTGKNWLKNWTDLGIVKHVEDQYFLETKLPSGLQYVGGTKM